MRFTEGPSIRPDQPYHLRGDCQPDGPSREAPDRVGRPVPRPVVHHAPQRPAAQNQGRVPAPVMKPFGERIADILIEDGLLESSQLEEILEIQKTQGGRLLKLLLDKKYVTEQDMMISMGRCLGTPPVN